jgi:hypothetical protein
MYSQTRQLSNIFDKLDIPVPYQFNCDEKGWQLGVTGNEKVVVILQRDPDDERDRRVGGSKQRKFTFVMI